jgi:hypothetical protein
MKFLGPRLVVSSCLVMAGAWAQNANPDRKTPDPARVSPMLFEGQLPPKREKPPAEPPAAKSTPAPKAGEAAAEVPPPPPPPPPQFTEQVVTVERVDAPPLELKEVTQADIAKVKTGFTSKEVAALLGPPASRVAIPEDDGRLRETLQFWGAGKLQGIVRLENGRVVTVEPRK